MNFNYRRYRISAEEEEYRLDPEHKNKPKDGTWYETEKGWSTVKPKDQKGPEEAEGDKTTEHEVTKEEKVLEDKKTEAEKSINDYYGEIDSEEKQRIESEAAQRLIDYIKKVSQGEDADLPELSDDDKERFIQCMFIALKIKQIESIPAATPQLARQKKDVVAKLYEHVAKGFDSIIESLGSKGLVEKHISPQDTKELFTVPEKSEKDVKDMTDEELSQHLLLQGKRDFQKQFIKKPSMRGKDISDVSAEEKDKAQHLADTASIYAKNFGSFNPRLKKSVKVKKTSNRVGFIMGEYKESPNSYYSDVTLPLDAEFDKIPHAMNELMKTLGASGFKGRVEMSTNAEDIALNKNNIRIIADDPRHLASANEIIKQSFSGQGVNVKTQVVKKQFGMSEDNQFAYRSKLKMLALKAGKNKTIAIPPSDAQNYLIAARLSGYDLVPAGKKFSLRPHDPKSEIGKMKLNTDENPKEALKRLQEAAQAESLPKKEEKYAPIPTEDPFYQTRLIQEELAENNKHFDEDLDDEYGDEFDNPRLEKAMRKRRKKTVEKPVETPEEPEPATEAETVKPPFQETISGTVKSIEEKVKAKDESAIKDFDEMLVNMHQELESNPDSFLLKQYQKAVNMTAASLLKGGYTQKMSAETAQRFEQINNELKQALVPPVPKTFSQLGLDKMGNYSAINPDTESLSGKNEIVGNDGYASGWYGDGNIIYSSDMNHKLTFNSQEEAEKFARKNPFLNEKKHLQIDPLDEDEDSVTEDKLVVDKTPDISRMSNFTDKYEIPESSPVLRELLGFKRLLLKKLGNEDRIKIREKGLWNFLSGESTKQLQKDFVDKMDESNYKGESFIDAKKKMADIDPQDFAKMVALVGKAKTASFKRRLIALSEIQIESISERIKS